jgi:hypothetical protein
MPETSLLIDVEFAAKPPTVNRAILGWMQKLTVPDARPEVAAVSYTPGEYYEA